MKLSNETVTVLKNFSTINQNLVIKTGSDISTIAHRNYLKSIINNTLEDIKYINR